VGISDFVHNPPCFGFLKESVVVLIFWENQIKINIRSKLESANKDGIVGSSFIKIITINIITYVMGCNL